MTRYGAAASAAQPRSQPIPGMAGPAPRQLRICCDPAPRARRVLHPVLAFPAGARQVARSISSSCVWRGGFGTAFSWQNTLLRAAPLILTALCVAIPARIGLVIIGGEGALVLGGFARRAVAMPMIGRVAADAASCRSWRSRPCWPARVWIGIAGCAAPLRGASTRPSHRCC